MFLWFIGTVVLSVHYVFDDPRFDYRLLVVGALAPDLVDLPLGRAGWAHSLTVAVVALAAVMIVTRRRSQRRSMLLGLPIGMLLHLVWDGAFTLTEVFWWPFSGGWGSRPVPTVGRGWWSVVLEVIGVLLVVHAVRRFGLRDAERWRVLRRDGTLTVVTDR